MTDRLILRPFASLEEYDACAAFQEEVWGRGFSEKVPSAILMIANRLGGLAAGAFDESGVLHGFVIGLTGVMDGKLVHWSDMLAVRENRKDRGLGTRLKRYQRDVMLGRGVWEMRWTFDPLQGRNAHVNFSKLGIVSREYVENMYGQTDSPLHRGVGTDRLLAIWSLDSERVESRMEMNAAVEEGAEVGGGRETGARSRDVSTLRDFAEVPRILPIHESGTFPTPVSPALGLKDPFLLLPIPTVIDTIMDADMSLAIRWREATREAFVHYIARGYEVREFFRGEPTSFYLLATSGETTGAPTP